MEWFEWAFILPILGWLGREIWSNVSQTNFMRKQSKNEHQYFKKRLIFEQKNGIYKELNLKLKKMVGVMNDFRSLDSEISKIHDDVIEEYARNNDLFHYEIYDDVYEHYEKDEEFRVEVNLNMRSNRMNQLHLEFSNYVSEQNYILTKDENEILFKINMVEIELSNYISHWKKIWKKEVSYSERKEEILTLFGDEYNNKFKDLEELMYEFMEIIRREMFM